MGKTGVPGANPCFWSVGRNWKNWRKPTNHREDIQTPCRNAPSQAEGPPELPLKSAVNYFCLYLGQLKLLTHRLTKGECFGSSCLFTHLTQEHIHHKLKSSLYRHWCGSVYALNRNRPLSRNLLFAVETGIAYKEAAWLLPTEIELKSQTTLPQIPISGICR